MNSPSAFSRPNEGTLGPYLRAIRNHRVVFLLVVIAALVGSVAWIILKSNEYEATTELLVTPLPQDDQRFLGFDLLRDSGDPTRTVQTAATLINSRVAASRTAQAIGDGYTRQKVINSVSISPQGESNIVAITATADSPTLAARIANQFSRATLQFRSEALQRQIRDEISRLQAAATPDAPLSSASRSRIEQLRSLQQRGDPTLSLSQEAAPPESASGAGAALIIALALFAGLALGAAAAVLLDLTNRTIVDEQEAATIFPLPVLARVPNVSSPRGSRGSSTGWQMQPSVREAYRSLLVQLERAQDVRVVMLTSATTGDGKTTSAVNTAVSMAAAGHSVVLMDFDIRKPDVARVLNVTERLELPALLGDRKPLEELLVNAPGIPLLRVLPTGSAGAGDFALVEGLVSQLPSLLEEAMTIADYVVVDTAPLGEVSDALRIIDPADAIILVVRPGETQRANFELTRDLLERSGRSPRGLLVIGDESGLTSTYYSYGMHQRRGMTSLGRSNR